MMNRAQRTILQGERNHVSILGPGVAIDGVYFPGPYAFSYHFGIFGPNTQDRLAGAASAHYGLRSRQGCFPPGTVYVYGLRPSLFPS